MHDPLLQVRDEIEHLLDDNEDMAQLYLTRKWLLNQQIEEAQLGATTSNNLPNSARSVRRLGSTRSESLATSHYGEDNDVEDLEMLLDAYFMQLDGTRNKILSVSVLTNRLWSNHVCQILYIETAIFAWFYYFSVSSVL